MLEFFANNPAFTMTSLTLSLNKVPFQPGLIGAMGLFRDERLSTTTAFIEVQGTRLALVPELPRGAPATPEVQDRRGAIPFRVPHFPTRASVYADQVQNVRAFGTEDQLQGVQQVIDDKEAGMSRRLDLTLEHLRLGAVKGTVITAVNRITGAAEMQYDLFDLFHVEPQPELEWPIVGAGAIGQDEAGWAGQLTGLVNALGRAMADEVSGGMFQTVWGIAGSVFFDAFAMHPERRGAYLALDARPLTDPILGTILDFRGARIVEYRGRIGGVPFVEPDVCYFFPRGAPDLFVEAYAPADYMETVNTIALPRYSKMEAMDFDKGVELEAQMNVLPLCTTPRALFRARATPYQPFSGASAQARHAPPSPRPHPERRREPAAA